jgi:hypothetical protein
MLVLRMGVIYEVRRWDDLRWHDNTKFHDDQLRNSNNNNKGITSNSLRGCSIGTTVDRNFLGTLLRLTQVEWYTYQVSLWWF